MRADTPMSSGAAIDGIYIASANMPRKSSAVQRPRIGLVADVGVAISTRRGMSAAVHASRGRVVRQLRRDAELALQRHRAIRRMHSRALRRCRCRRPARARRARARPASRVAASQIEAHHVVDHDAVREAVVQVGDGRQRVRARVDGAEILLERDRAHHRAHQHVAARLEIAPVAHGDRQRRARRCARLRAAMPSHSGWQPATGTTRRCASARPCRSRP